MIDFFRRDISSDIDNNSNNNNNDTKVRTKPIYRDKFTVQQVFKSHRILHTCDLLAVYDRFNEWYTVFKNREGIPHGTIITPEKYRRLREKSIAPIVLSTEYIKTDEEGKVIYG